MIGKLVGMILGNSKGTLTSDNVRVLQLVYCKEDQSFCFRVEIIRLITKYRLMQPCFLLKLPTDFNLIF